ncbi:4-hydroxybenzoyl-CoA thioesterase [Helicobacter valdiviensis]|uniref:4-hydroxybenzoyl-CoA thioesterase n=1 Tax=Helicobacter valdiviensis TaxID=1458358 RepID=A0A2W6MV96_9HELI|nr:YbgC/FadM family acyl-CoA thioesterase [Helicobacter valdiviensis]PZT48327.1 4-hydroxybenzoyl-CoA thioesterase [Helicobacter valdiviensis]
MKIRIYYEDTDCGGIVYHANYLKYCERARSEWFFTLGLSPQDKEVGFVVKSMQIEFLHPAKLGDLLEVKTKILELKSASILLEQEIFLQEKKIFSATILLVCIKLGENKIPKITKIPAFANEIFKNLQKD